MLNIGEAGKEVIQKLYNRAMERDSLLWSNFIPINLLWAPEESNKTNNIFDLDIKIGNPVLAVEAGKHFTRALINKMRTTSYRQLPVSDASSIDVSILVDIKAGSETIRALEKTIHAVEEMNFLGKSHTIEAYIIFSVEHPQLNHDESQRLKELAQKTSSLRRIYLAGDIDSSSRLIHLEKRNQVVADYIFARSVSDLGEVQKMDDDRLGVGQSSKIYSMGVCELTCQTETIFLEREQQSIEKIARLINEKSSKEDLKLENPVIIAAADEIARLLTLEGASENAGRSLGRFRAKLEESKNDSFRREVRDNLRIDKEAFSCVKDMNKLPSAMLNLFVYICETKLPAILDRIEINEKHARNEIEGEIKKKIDEVIRDKDISGAEQLVTSLNMKIDLEKKMRITNIGGVKQENYGIPLKRAVNRIFDLQRKIASMPRRAALIARAILISVPIAYLFGNAVNYSILKTVGLGELKTWIHGAIYTGTFVLSAISAMILGHFKIVNAREELFKTHQDCIDAMNISLKGYYDKVIDSSIDRLLQSIHIMTADPTITDEVELVGRNELTYIYGFKEELRRLLDAIKIRRKSPKIPNPVHVYVTDIFRADIDDRYNRENSPDWEEEAKKVYREISNDWREGKAVDYLAKIDQYVQPKLAHIKNITLDAYFKGSKIDINEMVMRDIIDRMNDVSTTCLVGSKDPRDIRNTFLLLDQGEENTFYSLCLDSGIKDEVGQIINFNNPYSSYFITTVRHEAKFVWETLPFINKPANKETQQE